MRDPAVERYLADLTRRCADQLGDDLVGVYAGGSLALGAYRPGRSDIDVAVVVRTALDDPTKQALVRQLRHESLPCPARGLELVVYTTATAGAGDPEPGFEVELNTGAGMAFRATYHPADRPPADGTFWYAIDRSILADHGRALVGPPAATLFVSAPEWGLPHLLAESLRWHLDSPFAATDDAVLNACRALHRARAGGWLDKGAAGVAVASYPGALDPTVIADAFRARDGGPPVDPERVRRFQRDVLLLLER